MRALFEFTGNASDTVPKTTAWLYMRAERSIGSNSYKLQRSFEDALERRGAKLTHGHGSNDRVWSGMKWRGAEATDSVFTDSEPAESRT